MKKDTKIAIVLIVLAILIVVIPPFALKGAEFGGGNHRFAYGQDGGAQEMEPGRGNGAEGRTECLTDSERTAILTL